MYEIKGLPWEAAPGWLLKAVREANGGKPPRGFYVDPLYKGTGLRVLIDGEAHIISRAPAG